ncbi:uncharacterized protein P174DRAFT_436147 [Aspergillus novofumigatus IBT 16806]|uniref:Uncharacterized protein n=1 Tax=Aspergillus novofumigatus (strain IBT 16806) TaxID=1392255 RepID=A0A2I1BT04_ASPN1|nr:uncharacterized protein P174DRAFT_436147 [Aspergillus novofumigatus IBT 16806]PKX88474.1 hypothetical protein P174DRAFT_436147 [Aspergillus novofumigatus IBT 16806]
MITNTSNDGNTPPPPSPCPVDVISSVANALNLTGVQNILIVISELAEMPAAREPIFWPSIRKLYASNWEQAMNYEVIIGQVVPNTPSTVTAPTACCSDYKYTKAANNSPTPRPSNLKKACKGKTTASKGTTTGQHNNKEEEVEEEDQLLVVNNNTLHLAQVLIMRISMDFTAHMHALVTGRNNNDEDDEDDEDKDDKDKDDDDATNTAI